MKNRFFLVIILTTLLSACSKNRALEEEHNVAPDEVNYDVLSASVSLSLSDILKITNARREQYLSPSVEIAKELGAGLASRSFDYMETFFTRETQEDYISSADAISDAELLFASMREYYPGYAYFGGDDVFLPIFEEILNYLRETETWAVSDFAYTIYESLKPYIKDNHFKIGDHVFSVNYLFYTNASAIFDKTDNGFRHRGNGLYVDEVHGYDLDTLFRLALDPSGGFYYTPIAMLPDADDFAEYIVLNIVYANGAQTVIPLYLQISVRFPWQNVSLHNERDFPVVTVRRMDSEHPDWQLHEDASRFISFAYELQNDPVVIVDARSNGGGYGYMPQKWLHALTGKIVSSKHISFTARSEQEIQQWIEDGSERDEGEWRGISRVSDILTYSPNLMAHGDHVIRYSPSEIIRREQLLILLIDRFTASAAETFTNLMLSVENTLIIGQNTSGSINFDAIYPTRLPLSGLFFQHGHTMYIFPIGFFEGRGLEPDIWTNGDALYATINMLERYFEQTPIPKYKP